MIFGEKNLNVALWDNMNWSFLQQQNKDIITQDMFQQYVMLLCIRN